MRADILNETASGLMQPMSVQNMLIYFPFVKSVRIRGYFLLLSNRA